MIISRYLHATNALLSQVFNGRSYERGAAAPLHQEDHHGWRRERARSPDGFLWPLVGVCEARVGKWRVWGVHFL